MQSAGLDSALANNKTKLDNMTDSTPFDELANVLESDGAPAAIDRLVEDLRERSEYHRLFDALLLKKKFELGAPLIRPTSMEDVPENRREDFEQAYIDAAREVGQLLLDDGNLREAWLYFRTIREPEKVREAIEQFSSPREVDEATEELIQIALYDGAHPVKGLEFMLQTHGTCNTITAMDQQLTQLSDEDRQRAAAMLVNTLYDDLCHTVRSEVQQRITLASPDESLRELIGGRDWLFEEGNYHIDVSHLNAVVRFARSLDGSSNELERAIQLAEYGSRLSEQFQYPADAPFDDFYPAHLHYFHVVAEKDREGGLKYFRDKLAAESDERDQQMIAYVLVDLLTRIGVSDEAVDLASQYLTDIDDGTGFSFPELCRTAGRLDRLRDVSRERGDLVTFAAALVTANHAESTK